MENKWVKKPQKLRPQKHKYMFIWYLAFIQVDLNASDQCYCNQFICFLKRSTPTHALVTNPSQGQSPLSSVLLKLECVHESSESLLNYTFWFRRGGARESAFLTSFQVVSMLLVCGPHFKQQGHGHERDHWYIRWELLIQPEQALMTPYTELAGANERTGPLATGCHYPQSWKLSSCHSTVHLFGLESPPAQGGKQSSLQQNTLPWR